MATLRSHILIEQNPSTVWKTVRDVAAISTWFPAIIASSGDRDGRTVTLRDGSKIDEDIVTLDDELRRLQYRAVGGDLPISHHLGTVDVLEIGPSRSLVVYSTEIEPAELASAFGPACAEGLQGLRDTLA